MQQTTINSSPAVRYALTLSLTLALCFAAQSLALHLSGGRTNKSESNFFSSLARIQTGIRDNPKIMLLGSSMTGRLPDRTQGFIGVANLGCDGSSAVDTLRAMDRGQLPFAPILVIEGNTIYRSVSAPPTEIAKAIGSLWFRVGKHFPNLGATARPAAFFYSRLLARKIGTPSVVSGSQLPVPAHAACMQEPRAMPRHAEVLVAELNGIVDRMRAKGTRFMLVIIPAGSPPDPLKIGIPYELSRIAGIPLVDLTKDLPANAVHYTDSCHMSPDSAAATLRTILRVAE